MQLKKPKLFSLSKQNTRKKKLRPFGLPLGVCKRDRNAQAEADVETIWKICD